VVKSRLLAGTHTGLVASSWCWRNFFE